MSKAQAVVLAAGLGTRLRPLTAHRPKALVPLCGQPMLRWALASLANAGVERVLVNAWHHPDQMTAFTGRQEGVDVEVIVESSTEPLGTGGGLRALYDRLAPRVLVVNADVICAERLTCLHPQTPRGGATLLLRRNLDDAARYGIVSIDASQQVVKLSSIAERSGMKAPQDTHFTGLHALDRDVLDLIPPGGPADIVRTAYRTLFDAHRLFGVVSTTTWLDIGNPLAYLTANLAVISSTIPLPLDPCSRAAYYTGPRGVVGRPPRQVAVEGPVWLGQGARIGAGCTIGHTVIGENAQIAPQTHLTNVVVWDNAIVPQGRWQHGIWHDGGWLPLCLA